MEVFTVKKKTFHLPKTISMRLNGACMERLGFSISCSFFYWGGDDGGWSLYRSNF